MKEYNNKQKTCVTTKNVYKIYKRKDKTKMTEFKTTCKPTGFDANLHKLDLFFPYNVLAIKDGKQFDFSVEVRDLRGKPDCKIGDFCNNIWYRPKQALHDNWAGYRTYGNLSRAVTNCLIKRGFTILGWYERTI